MMKPQVSGLGFAYCLDQFGGGVPSACPTNPERLFAAGYAAGFHDGLRLLARGQMDLRTLPFSEGASPTLA